MSIYIARGDDTLGPYQPAEAAELLKSGYLFPHDLAARNGDPAWVALSNFLTAEEIVPVVVDAPRPREILDARDAGAPAAAPSFPAAAPSWRPQWFLVAILPVLVLVAAGLLAVNLHRNNAHRHPLPPDVPGTFVRPQVSVPTASVAPRTPVIPEAPLASASPLPPAAPVAVSTATPPTEDQGGRWTGTVSLAGPRWYACQSWRRIGAGLFRRVPAGKSGKTKSGRASRTRPTGSAHRSR